MLSHCSSPQNKNLNLTSFYKYERGNLKPNFKLSRFYIYLICYGILGKDEKQLFNKRMLFGMMSYNYF